MFRKNNEEVKYVKHYETTFEQYNREINERSRKRMKRVRRLFICGLVAAATLAGMHYSFWKKDFKIGFKGPRLIVSKKSIRRVSDAEFVKTFSKIKTSEEKTSFKSISYPMLIEGDDYLDWTVKDEKEGIISLIDEGKDGTLDRLECMNSGAVYNAETSKYYGDGFDKPIPQRFSDLYKSMAGTAFDRGSVGTYLKMF